MATHVIFIINLLMVVRASIDSILMEVEEQADAGMQSDGHGKLAGQSGQHQDLVLAYPSGNEDTDAVPAKLHLANIDGMEFVRYQLDMLIRKDEFDSFMEGEDSTRKRRNAVLEKNLWPRIIPYVIEDQFNVSQQLTIVLAMQHIMQHTCLVFKSRTHETDYIMFVSGQHCESQVGKKDVGGKHDVSLTDSCVGNKATVVHEILHALGLYHEHMRNDRDAYLIIHKANITYRKDYQFSRLDEIQIPYNDYGLPYDYLSVMHYGKNFFGQRLNATQRRITIEPKESEFLDVIGEAPGLSFYDIQILNLMYKCTANCQQTACESGQFLGKACECYCNGSRDFAAVPCRANCTVQITSDPKAPDIVIKVGNKVQSITDNPLVGHGQEVEISYTDSERCGNLKYQSTCNNGTWDPPLELQCIKERCTIDPAWYNKYNVSLTKTLDPSSAIQTKLPHMEFLDLVCPTNAAINATWMCNEGKWEKTGDITQCDTANDSPPGRSFKCRSGRWLWDGLVCNGDNDCGDNTDEENCAAYKCPPERSFKCRSGRCLWDSDVCNGHDDCGDNADEENCAAYKCPPERSFKCRSGRCLWDSDVCDGHDDCGDNSDEENCAAYKCPPDRSFKCRSGRCIPEDRVCNGFNSCGDNSDEENCDACKPGAVQCPSGKCIRANWVCDGDNDCEDNSDEKDCGPAVTDKVGFCPPRTDWKGLLGACAPQCQVDADCRGNQKCCHRGCGLRCIDSVSEEPYQMDAPERVQFTGVSMDTISLAWSDPSLGSDQLIRDNRYYTVRYHSYSLGQYEYKDFTDMRGSVNGLRSDTEYEFAVRANNPPYLSQWSEGYKTTTRQTVVVKPGACPAPKADMAGICVEECQSDNNCKQNQKCCSNGCGKTCQYPNGFDICSLETDRGSCAKWEVRWFYDAKHGQCGRFWYGGCNDGNANNFLTEDACKARCIEAPPEMSIKALFGTSGPQPYNNRLIVKVLAVDRIVQYRNKNGEDRTSKTFAVTDGEDVIKVVAYDDKKFSKITIGATPNLRNVIPKKQTQPPYVVATSESKILTGLASIDVSADLMAQGQLLLNPPPMPCVPIAQALESPSKTNVSVKGKIVKEEPSKTVAVRGEEVPIKTFTLEDESGQTKVTLWRECVETKATVGDILLVTDVVTNEFNNVKSLNTTAKSTVEQKEPEEEVITIAIDGFDDDKEDEYDLYYGENKCLCVKKELLSVEMLESQDCPIELTVKVKESQVLEVLNL